MTDKVLRLISLVGLSLVSASLTTTVLADDGTLVLSQIPYYDKTNDATKTSMKSYAVAKGPKALAINPNGQIYWWGPEANPTEVSRRALENCELSYKQTCVLAVIDDAVQKLDPAAKLVSAFAALGRQCPDHC